MKNAIRIFWVTIKILLSVLFIYGGIQHFLKPTFYEPFVPAFLPLKLYIIYISGALEILLGLALIIKKYSYWGATGILLLLLIFLPVHIWDIISDQPAIGSHQAALIRLPIQIIFIALAWKVRSLTMKK